MGVSQQSPSPNTSTNDKELTRQMRDSFLPSTTPSPNSRLSSGFGSLVDTDKSCESSHTNVTSSVKAQEPSVLPSPPSVRDQLIEQRLQNKMDKTKVKQSEHGILAQSNTIGSQSEQKKPGVAAVQTKPSSVYSEKSPKHIRRAWISPTSSQSFTVAKPNSIPSLKERKEAKQLLRKKEELKRTEHEQMKLFNQVQLLDLHVEEEKLK